MAKATATAKVEDKAKVKANVKPKPNPRKGNFLDATDLPDELLKEVDVIFVNNVAFESSLNRALMERS